jgi:hypothetical protein
MRLRQKGSATPSSKGVYTYSEKSNRDYYNADMVGVAERDMYDYINLKSHLGAKDAYKKGEGTLKKGPKIQYHTTYSLPKNTKILFKWRIASNYTRSSLNYRIVSEMYHHRIYYRIIS